MKKASRSRKTHGLKVGDVYQDCAYHPVRCTELDGDDISGISLLDGSSPRSCSIKHCGVRKMKDNEVKKAVAAWEKGGEKELMRLNGWEDKDIKKFHREWRSPHEANRPKLNQAPRCRR